MSNILQVFEKGYRAIICFGNCLQSFLLLVIRLFWGCQFFQTGLGKFSNMENVMAFFSSLGIPFPCFNAYLVAMVELVGGLCLFFGFASRLASIPLVITMVVAYFTAHFDAVKTMFSDPNTFLDQAPFLFLYASLLVFAFGPGKFSLDYLIERRYFPQSK